MRAGSLQEAKAEGYLCRSGAALRCIALARKAGKPLRKAINTVEEVAEEFGRRALAYAPGFAALGATRLVDQSNSASYFQPALNP